MTPQKIAALLVEMGCPAGKSLQMACQLQKRARQLAEQKRSSYDDALAHLLGIMKQGWAAKEKGM
jgi:hypothetical protein